MSATSDAERAAFEATVGKDRDIHRAASGDYMSTYVQNDWGVWQVARKEIQRAACNFCLSEAAKARAALPIDFKQATDQGGWQPIATAPKGKRVLLFSERCKDISIGDWGDYDLYNQPKFTLWQPLPAAPTLLGVADGDAVSGKSGGAA